MLLTLYFLLFWVHHHETAVITKVWRQGSWTGARWRGDRTGHISPSWSDLLDRKSAELLLWINYNRVRFWWVTLPFTSLDLLRVERALFKVRKPKLCWRCCVAIRSSQYHFHSKVLDAFACFFASMIRCSIQDKDDIFSPLSTVLRCETRCQFWQEHHHYILISITLRLRHPDWSLWRDCNNDVDFMSKHSISDWLSFPTSVPRSTSKVCLRHPTFVNVDDMFSFTVNL